MRRIAASTASSSANGDSISPLELDDCELLEDEELSANYSPAFASSMSSAPVSVG